MSLWVFGPLESLHPARSSSSVCQPQEEVAEHVEVHGTQRPPFGLVCVCVCVCVSFSQGGGWWRVVGEWDGKIQA